MILKRLIKSIAGLSALILVTLPAAAHPGHGELGLLHHVIGGDYWFITLGLVVLLAMGLARKLRS